MILKNYGCIVSEKNINFELIKKELLNVGQIGPELASKLTKKIICDLHADMVAVVSKSRSHRRGFTTHILQCIPYGILQKLNNQQL